MAGYPGNHILKWVIRFNPRNITNFISIMASFLGNIRNAYNQKYLPKLRKIKIPHFFVEDSKVAV